MFRSGVSSRGSRDRRDGYRDRRERLSPPPKRDSSPPPVKRVRREV